MAPVGADAQHVPAGVAGKGGVVALEHSDKGLAEEYDYFLLKADGPGRVLTTVEKDNYGAGFIPGDIVIEVRFAYWCCVTTIVIGHLFREDRRLRRRAA